jgi:hypothetical protein
MSFNTLPDEQPFLSYYTSSLRVLHADGRSVEHVYGMQVGVDFYDDRIESIALWPMQRILVIKGEGEDFPRDDRHYAYRKTVKLSSEQAAEIRQAVEPLGSVRAYINDRENFMRFSSLEYDIHIQASSGLEEIESFWALVESITDYSRELPGASEFTEIHDPAEGLSGNFSIDHAWKWQDSFDCRASLDFRYIGSNRAFDEVARRLEGDLSGYKTAEKAWTAFLGSSLMGIEWGLWVGINYERAGVYFNASDYEDFDQLWITAADFGANGMEKYSFRSIHEVYGYFAAASEWMEAHEVGPSADSNWYRIVPALLKELRCLVCASRSEDDPELLKFFPAGYLEKKAKLAEEEARLAEEERRLSVDRFMKEGPGADALPGTHPSMLDGFKPISFIWYYDHVEGCAPDEKCWMEVSEKLRDATNDYAPMALIGDYPPEQKSERLWEQVLWADEYRLLEQLNDWLFVCDDFDFERKKWQKGCAFHEVAYRLYSLASTQSK